MRQCHCVTNYYFFREFRECVCTRQICNFVAYVFDWQKCTNICTQILSKPLHLQQVRVFVYDIVMNISSLLSFTMIDNMQKRKIRNIRVCHTNRANVTITFTEYYHHIIMYQHSLYKTFCFRKYIRVHFGVIWLSVCFIRAINTL